MFRYWKPSTTTLFYATRSGHRRFFVIWFHIENSYGTYTRKMGIYRVAQNDRLSERIFPNEPFHRKRTFRTIHFLWGKWNE